MPTCKSAKITEFLARQRLFQKFGPLSLIYLDVGPLEKKVGHPCSRGFLVELLHFFFNLDIRKDTRASKVNWTFFNRAKKLSVFFWHKTLNEIGKNENENDLLSNPFRSPNFPIEFIRPIVICFHQKCYISFFQLGLSYFNIHTNFKILNKLSNRIKAITQKKNFHK